jgi:hypothetical protein
MHIPLAEFCQIKKDTYIDTYKQLWQISGTKKKITNVSSIQPSPEILF